MSETELSADDLFLGDTVVSFVEAILTPMPNSISDQITAGIVLLLTDGQTAVIKFTLDTLRRFIPELSGALQKFPDVDQRDALEALMERHDSGEKVFESIQSHPISIYIARRPTAFPESAKTALNSQYVKFVHINAYPDVFKFDFTFADKSTRRISMASCVAVYFKERLEKLYDAISGMER